MSLIPPGEDRLFFGPRLIWLYLESPAEDGLMNQTPQSFVALIRMRRRLHPR